MKMRMLFGTILAAAGVAVCAQGAAVCDALGPKIAAQPFDALVNRGMEERSRILWLVKPTDRPRFLLLVKAALKQHPAHDVLGTCGRDDNCECNSCWVRRGGYNVPQDKCE